MKLNKKLKSSKKIFELHFIKSKNYELLTKKKNLNNLPHKSLSDVIINFKKSLNIIFKYHKNNRRILFVGLPKEIEKKINLNTIHTSISNLSYFTNKFTLNNFIFNSLKINKNRPKKNQILSLKTQKKPELIVLLKENQKESVIKKDQILKIPIIKFNHNVKRTNWDYSYNIPGNLNKNNNNFFFIILNSLFNKSYRHFH